MICDRIDKGKMAFNSSKKTLLDKKGGKSKYIISNPSNGDFSIIDFEKDIRKSENESICDFGMLTDDSFYYIELKGRSVEKGIKQLLTTIRLSNDCFPELSKKSRLVVSRFPNPNLAKKRKEYLDLKRLSEVIVKQNQYTEII